MSGISRLRHVAAMNPPGRGSIFTSEAREVLDRLTALEAAGRELADVLRAGSTGLYTAATVGALERWEAALAAVPAGRGASGSGEAPLGEEHVPHTGPGGATCWGVGGCAGYPAETGSGEA